MATFDDQAFQVLVAEVSPDRVKSLLIARAPSFMDVDSGRYDSFLEIVRGVAIEVAAVTGTDVEGGLRNLAVWAITLGSAAHIEATLAPEQVFGGEQGAAQVLKLKYLGVLAQLRTDEGQASAQSPTGDFPDPTDLDGLFNVTVDGRTDYLGTPWW